MKALLKKLRENRAKAVKQRLPVTVAGVNALIDTVLNASGLDIANDTARAAICGTLMRLPEGTRFVSVSELVSVVEQSRMKQSVYAEIERIQAAAKAATIAENAANAEAQ